MITQFNLKSCTRTNLLLTTLNNQLCISNDFNPVLNSEINTIFSDERPSDLSKAQIKYQISP